MGFSSHLESNSSVLSNNRKVIGLESSLQESIVKFKDLILDFEQLHFDSENYKQKYLSVRDKCENKTCSGAVELKKIIATKDQIIQSVASTLTKLNETENFSVLSDAFKILCKDTSPLTPPFEDPNTHSSISAKNISPLNKNMGVKKEAETSTANVSFEEESFGEIEGTPTGRTSPIIHTKKTRSTLAKSSDFRDKKKCPDDWPTPESKAIKLIFSTPTGSKSGGSGRLRQQRLDLVKLKQTSVVDLTCSPEVLKNVNGVQPLTKMESIENDDTILPSPTSGPANFNYSKTTSKPSPVKFKKPPLSLKSKSENVIKYDESKNMSKQITEMEESINILFANRLRDGIKKENKTTVKIEEDALPEKENKTPVKMEVEEAREEDATHCETNSSISLLQQIDRIEATRMKMHCSPCKRPLAENINVVNTPPRADVESSLSILPPAPGTAAVGNVKRKIPELVEPVYKEPTVRNKADKRNLRGWSCEECKNFYGILYKNDPVLLAKKINECSKHRGEHDPARARTPPNFWNPRWDVPEGTEELNRMNNAI